MRLKVKRCERRSFHARPTHMTQAGHDSKKAIPMRQAGRKAGKQADINTGRQKLISSRNQNIYFIMNDV